MGKTIDLKGREFGRLKVVCKYGKDKYGKILWKCKCNCGNKKDVLLTTSQITGLRVLSCGCLRAENTSKALKRYNTYDLSGDYGIGYTFNGEKFYFDLDDYDKIKDYCWHIDKNGYVISHDFYNNQIRFHRVILNPSKNMIVDHINHIKIDNRRCNLRIAKQSNNCMNQGLSKNNTSGVTGVVWNEYHNKWAARIKVNRKDIFIGYYSDFDKAVKARKEAEEKYFGEYSYDNSIRQNNCVVNKNGKQY